MDIFKDQLPAGWSFGLKPSKLESAVANAGLQLPVVLHQWHKVCSIDAPALSAMFYPRGSHLGRDDGCFSVSSCAVPSDQRAALSEYAEGVFLPQLIAWMVFVEELPNNTPVKREGQEFALHDSPRALSKRPLPLTNKGHRKGKRA